MKKKILILNSILFLCSGCTSIKPYFKKSDIETRQGKVSIINAIGLNQNKDNLSLIGKPHKDQNNSDIIRQEYSLQVDF